MDVARQPVQFGDDECCLRSLCVCEGFGKLGPVGPLARLDLLVGGDDLVLALSSVVGNAGVLGFQAETAFTLPSCRNPVVRYQLAHRFVPVLRVESTYLGILLLKCIMS